MFMALATAATLTFSFGAGGGEALLTAPAAAAPPATAPAAVAPAPLLGALGPGASDSALASTGFGEVVIASNWAQVEPGEGSYSTSAISGLQAEINTALASGLQPSLDLGLQYAPSWIFGVGGGTRFVDQYGDVFTGLAGSGNDVANAVTDPEVRAQVANYVAYLGSHLSGVSSVRVGGGAYNELRYPSGTWGGQTNAYWFYDSSSQSVLPESVQGWTPGTGTVAQATTFLNAYNAALDGYGVWLANQAANAFPASPEIEVLLPGWGERPGEAVAAEGSLLTLTPDEINQGLDWVDLLNALPATSQFVAYTTYADATNGTPSNPSPAAYIHSILPTGMEAGGESTGNGLTTPAGMTLIFYEAQTWHWYVANWFFNNQPQTPALVAQAWNLATGSL